MPFRSHFSFLAFVLLIITVSCQRVDINTTEAVQSAVAAHIASRGDLSLSELDITVSNMNFQGDRCEAEVLFAPKGQGAENAMTMRYELEREGDTWKVKPKAPGAHAGAPPAEMPAPPAGESPALPAGHPPVAPDGAAVRP